MGERARPSRRTPASAPIPSPPARRCWSSRLCWTLRGPTPRPDASRARRWATTMTVAVTLVAALACGCADAGTGRPCRGRAEHPHRHQHAAGSAGQADHGHAQLGLADRTQRNPDPGRAEDHGRRRRHDGQDLVGPPVHADRPRDRRRARHASRADLLPGSADHRAAHQRRRPGRPVRRVAGAAGDQVVEGHRRRDLQDGCEVFVSGVEGRRRQVRPGRGHQHRPVASAGVDLQTLCAACGFRGRQGRHRQLGRPAHGDQGRQDSSARRVSTKFRTAPRCRYGRPRSR